jgi:hypothetical protein
VQHGQTVFFNRELIGLHERAPQVRAYPETRTRK